MGRYEEVFILNDKVTAKLEKITKAFEPLNKKLVATQRKFEAFERRTQGIKKLGEGMTNLGSKLTVGVTLPVVAMGGAMVKAAADIESMQQQLETMTGSAEAGGKMFSEIKTMAAKTPFETKDLMKATNTMLGFGIAQEKVLPLMNQLGDISGGNADRFQSLALAFSQVSSAGKLQGQDLNQMINAGFNPLESIAKRTGKSVGYWKEQMSKGKVTTQMVEQAMKDATSQGGRFFGMMDKQSKTALGQWSTFQDNLNMLLAEFGKIILPTAISVLQKLSSALERFNSLSEGTKKTILVIGGIAAAIGPVITIVGALIKSVAGLNVALAFLAANPIVAVLTGIAAATWLVIKGIEALIKKLTALKAIKISGKSFNLESESNLKFWSDEKKKLGAKEFNKKYDRSIQKAVKNYDKSQNNSNNTTTTNNSTVNNYFTPISATNRSMQYSMAH